MKNQKGITLIALIITIIVMLILVGVSVSTALNTGLFKTAQGAAKNTQIAINEEGKLANGTINVNGIGETNISDYISHLKGENWELTEDKDGDGGLSIGDLVIHKEKTTEKFYVINVTENEVAMLAAKNITTTGTLEQSDTAPKVVFSTANYWASVPGIAYPDTTTGKYPDLNDETTYPIGDEDSIVTVAKAYGDSLGVTGRLMTYEEAEALKSANSTILYGQYGEGTSLSFWLGSARRRQQRVHGSWSEWTDKTDRLYDKSEHSEYVLLYRLQNPRLIKRNKKLIRNLRISLKEVLRFYYI